MFYNIDAMTAEDVPCVASWDPRKLFNDALELKDQIANQQVALMRAKEWIEATDRTDAERLSRAASILNAALGR